MTDGVVKKRDSYLQWDEYFMSIAFLSAQRSKDPNSQVGACIVNEENKIVGIGYNGMPLGCDDDLLPWARESKDPLGVKYLYICHAEMNAILNKNSANLSNCTVYVTLYPCNECSKLIIQSRIKRVVYYQHKYTDTVSSQASARLLSMAGVEVAQFVPKRAGVEIQFGPQS